jgi:hypothetical protein
MHLLGSWRTNFGARHQLYRTSPQHLFCDPNESSLFSPSVSKSLQGFVAGKAGYVISRVAQGDELAALWQFH